MSKPTYTVKGADIAWDSLAEAKTHGYLLRAKAMIDKLGDPLPDNWSEYGDIVTGLATLARMIQVEEQRSPLSGIFGGNS